MIGIPSFQQTSPSDTARAWEGGFGEGASAIQGADQIRLERQRLKEESAEFAQQFQLQQQRAQVQDEILKQQHQMAIQQAARAFDYDQKRRAYIEAGGDPIKASLMWPGGSNFNLPTGAFGAYQREQAGPPTTTVVGPDGKPVGDPIRGNVRVLPPARVPPQMYDTVTTTTPGTPGTPGVPAVAPDPSIWNLWSDKGQPAIPGKAGTPTVRETRRVPIPMGPPYDQSITNTPTATAPKTMVQQDVDDPLGILNK